MQSSAPELMDVSKESPETLKMYGAEAGKPSFAMNCLLARRMIERVAQEVAQRNEDGQRGDRQARQPEREQPPLRRRAERAPPQPGRDHSASKVASASWIRLPNSSAQRRAAIEQGGAAAPFGSTSDS